MSDAALPWTGEQWDRIRQVVHDEALRTRVAASFLPLYGPLPGGTEIVPKNAMEYQAEAARPGAERMVVNDHDSMRLCSVSVNVYLRNHMLADPELAAAITMFRRAASIIARVEDAILFNGRQKDTRDEDGRDAYGVKETGGIPKVYEVGGEEDCLGLLEYGAGLFHSAPQDKTVTGPTVFTALVNGILELERNAYFKPYGLVLGHSLFARINEPIPNSMVLPRDSIPPFLDGPMLRSSNLPADTGLLVSLMGEPVEIVVPGDISVRYLQPMLDGSHAFRVSGRFRLRVKDPGAIVSIKVG